MPITWNPDGAAYLDDGSPIDADSVIETEGEYLEESTVAIAALATRMANKEITSTQFGDLLWTAIKDAYIVSYLFGRGGLASMTQQDWGSVGGALGEQRKYLNRFVEQLGGGEMPEGSIANRSAMYINSARESFERGRYRAVVVSGAFTEERWVFGATEVHCGGCQDYAGLDWVKLGRIKAFPGDGSTECLTWCGCHKEYR